MDILNQLLALDLSSFLTLSTLKSLWPVALILVGLLIIISGIYILRAVFHARDRNDKAFQKIILLIRVPKERKSENPGGAGEDSINQIREQIAVSETIFSAIAGLHPEKGFGVWLRGRNDHASFEIVVKENKISFYVAVPEKIRDFVEQQIHAQYPHAEITEESDYNIFKPKSVVVGAYLWLKHQSAFPLKNYQKMDNDPLVALLNPLSKVSENEGAVIQYIVRPASTSWRKQGVALIRTIRSGKKFEGIMEHKWYKGFSGEGGGKKDKKNPEEAYHLSQTEEEMVKSMEEKMSHGGLEVTMRIVSSSDSREHAQLNLENILNAYSQYNIYRYGNTLTAAIPKNPTKLIQDSIYRTIHPEHLAVLSTTELTSLWHLPTASTETPHVNWLGARKAAPPTNIPREGIILGRSVYRGEETIIRMKRSDRRRHLYAIGKSGSGKSVFIQNLAVQDVLNGEGVCVIDPHGDFVEYVLQHVPKERAEDVIYFNPSDIERPIGLNMLEVHSEEQKDFATQEMISIFYKMVTDPSMIGPMFEHNMRNVMLTLMSDLETPGTIAEIPRMFSDDSFVTKWKKKLKDPMVLAYWDKEMAKTSDFHKSEMLGYLISKVGRFVENEMVRNIIGQSHSGFNFREVMDKKKILLVNLAKGKVGEINANLLGMIIVSKLQMTALERADLPEEQRNDFFLYIDEFQNFITESIATILSEARKYRLELIIAHQYMKQLEDNKGKTTVRDAVLGNAGTIVSFRIGVEDADILQKEFAPVFGSYDLLNVEQYTAYVKLLIDNTAARPFNMLTYPPQPGNPELAAAIKELSRLKYGRPRDIVSAEILERSALGAIKPNHVDLSEATL
jgi:type IV secretory pathway TraG/TraD family ATPase VirD4